MTTLQDDNCAMCARLLIDGNNVIDIVFKRKVNGSMRCHFVDELHSRSHVVVCSVECAEQAFERYATRFGVPET